MIPVFDLPTVSLPADPVAVREATAADELALLELGALADEPPLARPALVAEVGGIPTAAISLADGRVLADPYQDCGALEAVLRARAGSV